jgi:uncharacterized cupin superfamily protein
MAMIVTENAFKTKKQAIAEIKAANLWLFEFEPEPAENPAHWHDFYGQVYILEGQVNLRDEASGTDYACGPGTRVIVPPRTLHSEQILGYKAVIGLSVDPATLGEDINLSPAALG